MRVGALAGAGLGACTSAVPRQAAAAVSHWTFFVRSLREKAGRR